MNRLEYATETMGLVKMRHVTAVFFVDSWKETGNAERMAKTLCSFLPFPRSLHLWDGNQCRALCYVLEGCAEFSELLTFAEVHGRDHCLISHVTDLLELADVKSVIMYGEREFTEYEYVVQKLDKTLVELTFALCGDVGESLSKVPDFGLSSVRLRICGSLGLIFIASC